jgi:peptidoglycan hydrolase-like protein with peptidoglycan-binding domain
MLLSGWMPARAATIETIPSGEITLVVVSGELQFGDEETFADKVLRLKDAVVMFDSIGGSLRAGIEIGKAIRLKGFGTLVPNKMLCASACALAWLGGKVRLAGPEARIAFHAAWKMKNGQKMETGPGNALVGAYLNNLGLSEEAILFVTSAGPDDAEFLSFQRAERLGIRVERFPPAQGQKVARSEQKQSEPELPADPDARYYGPAATPSPGTSAAPPSIGAETEPSPTRPNSSQTAWLRPEMPDMKPQMLDLANLEAAAQVQRRLQERGFFQGIVDGVWGQRSRIAIRDFKIRNGLGSDDGWDLKTQLALFDDRYQAASATYAPTYAEQDVAGLYMPFAAPAGASLHPLNPVDALKIQERLFQLNYYRKQGDGVWGMASRSALTDFKVAHGLPADDVWDGSVEEALRGSRAVPATETPFGEWIQAGTVCGDPNNPGRLVVSSKQVTALAGTCQLGSPLQRARDGWRSAGTCTRGAASAQARIHFQLFDRRLVDRSVVGVVSNGKPAVFSRCM